MAPAVAATSGDALSHLVVRRQAASPPEQTARAIRDAVGWLGPVVAEAPVGMLRHQADLRLRVSERPSFTTFHKAAFVDLGPVETLGDGWQVEVSWRAATLVPLFPVFAGTIIARGDELTVSGWYAPPGGAVGRVADRALLHIAAEGTGRWLLGELDHAAGEAPGY